MLNPGLAPWAMQECRPYRARFGECVVLVLVSASYLLEYLCVLTEMSASYLLECLRVLTEMSASYLLQCLRVLIFVSAHT